MKKVGILLMLIVLIAGCNDEFSSLPCNDLSESGINQKPWLREAIEDMNKSAIAEYSFIVAADYKGSTALVFGNCCPFCGTVVSVYDCSGSFLGFLGQEIQNNELKNQKVIWRHVDSECNFN